MTVEKIRRLWRRGTALIATLATATALIGSVQAVAPASVTAMDIRCDFYLNMYNWAINHGRWDFAAGYLIEYNQCLYEEQEQPEEEAPDEMPY